MSKIVLGIDISKKDFHVTLILENQTTKSKVFKNNPEGFLVLKNWLSKQGATQVHGCMEATSTYGEALAEFLVENGHKVSVVNPSRIKGFAKSELLRTKTDKVDAAVIARFCLAIAPEIWTPLPVEVKELQALLRRLESLTDMYQQEHNRLETATPTVAALIESHLEQLKQLIVEVKQLIHDHFECHPDLKAKRDLLTSIPGIGEQTAAVLLTEMGCIEQYRNARQLAAHAGLTPQERSSGSSVQAKSHLSRIGNARLRKALYMPAVAAMRHNPLLKLFAQRLLDRGKVKMQVLGAVMRKLLHFAFAILKSQKPFDPDYLAHAS
ncbi:IS110 family transposase [Calothrix sp. PCC 7507]|uniref:IS110 family transposase n=1 Tax=Calothrix sp. PCC 7507 TaxID=99598 RepID=UPI00029EC8C0|nr:IS110 family transposase [Calothrix sp. PCC 7507]AFY33855.1 transposase IS116/IS110/IS902 family protein [Calothrix sp. PCC 7507]